MVTDLQALSTPELLDIIWAGIKRYKESGEWKSGKITADRQMVHEAMDEIGVRIEKGCPELIQQGYEIKVGKGVGRFPKIPWISLLPPNQRAASGVYGVACINGDGDGYVVGPITSVTDKEISRGIKTIKRPKAEIRVDVGNYNDAYASFKEVTRAEVRENDIVQLIIKAAMEADKIRTTSSPIGETETPTSIERTREQDHAELLLCALAAKPFAILAGGTGTGKTRSAIGIAESLVGTDEKARKNQIAVVSVQADWTDKRSLLGYRNMLSANGAGSTYVSSEAVRLMLRANANKTKPFFLILDEMNLSYVERYFADFLSAMESRNGELHLHREGVDLPRKLGAPGDVPESLSLPDNVFIIGTVNVDETTYMFSPKVLDRANVLEFRVDKDAPEAFLNAGGKRIGEIAAAPEGYAESFLQLSHRARGLNGTPPLTLAVDPANPPPEAKEGLTACRTAIVELFALMQRRHQEFAFRTMAEILRFLAVDYELTTNKKEWKWQDAMDAQILQKILPKLHGSKRKIGSLLAALAKYCEGVKAADAEALLIDETKAEGYPAAEDKRAQAPKYRQSHRKLCEMIEAVRRDQFVSFIQ